MFGLKQLVVDQYNSLFQRVERVERIVGEIREWVELMVDESRPDPDTVAERFVTRLQARVRDKGKALSSEEMRELVKEALNE
jgi:hypothetical protein